MGGALWPRSHREVASGVQSASRLPKQHGRHRHARGDESKAILSTRGGRLGPCRALAVARGKLKSEINLQHWRRWRKPTLPFGIVNLEPRRRLLTSCFGWTQCLACSHFQHLNHELPRREKRWPPISPLSPNLYSPYSKAKSCDKCCLISSPCFLSSSPWLPRCVGEIPSHRGAFGLGRTAIA